MPDPLRKTVSATEVPAFFASRVTIGEGGCWLWAGAKNTHGYGHLKLEGKYWQAHRLMYVSMCEEISSGMVVDHLCRNRSCVNPDHLEAVTNKENLRRGDGFTGTRFRQTHCKRGHQFTDGNTLRSNGGRTCRECARLKYPAVYRRGPYIKRGFNA